MDYCFLYSAEPSGHKNVSIILNAGAQSTTSVTNLLLALLAIPVFVSYFQVLLHLYRYRNGQVTCIIKK